MKSKNTCENYLQNALNNNNLSSKLETHTVKPRCYEAYIINLHIKVMEDRNFTIYKSSYIKKKNKLELNFPGCFFLPRCTSAS